MLGWFKDTCGAGFILETAHHFLGVQTMDIKAHGFQGYGAADGRVRCFVHDAHGAAPKLTVDSHICQPFGETYLGSVLSLCGARALLGEETDFKPSQQFTGKTELS